MSINDDIQRALHKPVFWKRILVRDGDGLPWRWFGPPVAFTVSTAHLTQVAYAVLEDQAVEAAFYHPTQHVRMIHADTLEAFEQMDLTDINL